MPTNTVEARPSSILWMVSELVMLALMLVGVWRKKAPGGLWKTAYRHACIIAEHIRV